MCFHGLQPVLTDPLEERETLAKLNNPKQRKVMWLDDFTLETFAAVPSSFSPREAEKMKTSAPV